MAFSERLRFTDVQDSRHAALTERGDGLMYTDSSADQPVRGMLHSIEAQLDDERGSLDLRDDLTIVGLEVLS